MELKEMDKHLLPGWPNYVHTYLWKNFREHGTAIRFPGATRGHIEFDDDKVITKIVLYETAVDIGVKCYKESVKDAVQKYIGAKIVFKGG